MNFNDFEVYIDDTILQRGLDYYKRGHVESLELIGDRWVADVSGSDMYTVTAVISDSGEIVDTSCDCPYDFGEYCKHQAAVLYALRDKEKSGESIKKEINTKNKKPKESLEDVLQKQDKPVLVSLLLEYARENPQINDDIMLRYSTGTGIESRAKSLIKSSIRSAMRRGYVEYRDVGDAVDGAYKVLRIAETMENRNGVSLCILVLREMMNLLDNCDDSDGIVGGVITEAIEMLGDITESLAYDSPDTEHIFDLIMSHASERIYDGWSDWRIDILSACVPLCNIKKRRDKLEGQIAALADKTGEDSYGRYYAQELQRMKYDLTKSFDGEDAADRYINAHLDNSDFRTLAIDKAIKANDFGRALELCIDGEKKDAEYAGLVMRWKEKRYRVYEAQRDKDALCTLAEEFVIGGDFGYYQKLKALYAPGEWGAILPRVLDNLKKSRYLYSTYIEVLVFEDMKPELLEYCRKSPSMISRLAAKLLPDFRDEAALMYEEYIRNEAANASDRSHYKRVCGTIKAYCELFDAEGARAIKNELTQKYPRRPAFLDELGKLRI